MWGSSILQSINTSIRDNPLNLLNEVHCLSWMDNCTKCGSERSRAEAKRLKFHSLGPWKASSSRTTPLIYAFSYVHSTFCPIVTIATILQHPLTAEHLRIVREVVRYHVVGPIGKILACGDVGLGAMTEWLDIVKTVVDRFNLRRKVTQ